MPKTIRKFWPDAFSEVTAVNFNWDEINTDSVVLVTASEYVPQPNAPRGTPLKRFVGDATIRIDDIAPHGPPFDNNRGVTFVIVVDFPNPVFVVTDITLLDATVVDTQEG